METGMASKLRALVKISEQRLYSRAYVAICGDVLAGIVLGQIVYWFERLEENEKWGVRNKGDGRVWLAKSNVEFTEEIGLSRKQLDRVFAILEENQFVETRLWRFNGAPVRHVWLNEEAVAVALMVYGGLIDQPKVSGGSSPIAPNGQIHCAKGANPFVQNAQCITEITSETTAESTTSAKADPEASLLSLGENVGTAKDFLKQVQVEKGLKEEPRTMKVMKLDLLWRKLVAEKTGVFQQQLSGKELGYLKALMTQAGEEAGPVIEWAALNWSKLAFECDLKGGPSLGALVTHWQTAVKLMLAKPKKVEETKGFDKLPSTIEPVKEEAEAPISPEDQLAMMNKYLKPDA